MGVLSVSVRKRCKCRMLWKREGMLRSNLIGWRLVCFLSPTQLTSSCNLIGGTPATYPAPAIWLVELPLPTQLLQSDWWNCWPSSCNLIGGIWGYLTQFLQSGMRGCLTQFLQSDWWNWGLPDPALLCNVNYLPWWGNLIGGSWIAWLGLVQECVCLPACPCGVVWPAIAGWNRGCGLVAREVWVSLALASLLFKYAASSAN